VDHRAASDALHREAQAPDQLPGLISQLELTNSGESRFPTPRDSPGHAAAENRLSGGVWRVTRERRLPGNLTKGCSVIPGGRATTATATRCFAGTPECAQHENGCSSAEGVDAWRSGEPRFVDLQSGGRAELGPYGSGARLPILNQRIRPPKKNHSICRCSEKFYSDRLGRRFCPRSGPEC
jgi:hypothetical protein